MRVISDDEFYAQYKPVQNHIEANAYEGRMFETYGPEWDFVKSQDPHYVWTLLDCENKTYVSCGFHAVNRIGYFITENPHNYDVEDVDLDPEMIECRVCCNNRYEHELSNGLCDVCIEDGEA